MFGISDYLSYFCGNNCGEEHIRGPEVPCFIEETMIDAKTIEQLVTEKIQGTDLFLVEIKVDSRNQITIFLDTPQGISIDQCVEISRHVEHSFDRAVEDFSLEVSSPGIGYPFRVVGQYQKAIGRTVEVLFTSGIKIKGVLKDANEQNFTLSYTTKEKPEGAKRPVLIEKNEPIDYTNVKSVKEIITF